MEGFFLTGSVFDEVEIKELLLHRYHTLSMIDDFSLIDFLEFVNMAREKERREFVYREWCAFMPMSVKYIPFEEYYDRITGRNIDMRPAEEIVGEIEDIEKEFKRKEVI